MSINLQFFSSVRTLFSRTLVRYARLLTSQFRISSLTLVFSLFTGLNFSVMFLRHTWLWRKQRVNIRNHTGAMFSHINGAAIWLRSGTRSQCTYRSRSSGEITVVFSALYHCSRAAALITYCSRSRRLYISDSGATIVKASRTTQRHKKRDNRICLQNRPSLLTSLL